MCNQGGGVGNINISIFEGWFECLSSGRLVCFVRGISVYQNSNEWQESAFPEIRKKISRKVSRISGDVREKFPDKTEEFL